MGPMEIMAQARGFMLSRVILSAAQFDFFTVLEATPMSAADLATRLALDARATTRLLDSLVAAGLLTKQNDAYQVTPASACLSARHPQTMLPMVLHMNGIWNNWSTLSEAVKTGTNDRLESVVAATDDRQRQAFIGAMHVIGRQLAQEIAAAYDLSPFRQLLDIGGASGTYTIAFLAKNPVLRAVLFDLPGVTDMAKERIAAEKLAQRVTIVSGDFYRDALPGGCDLALLSAIIHQNSPQQNVELYRKIWQALQPGGKLLIRDHIMDESRTQPADGALFAINMLVNTAAGDTYTFAEVKAHLEQAGFGEVRMVRQGERMDCLVEAQKPQANAANPPAAAKTKRGGKRNKSERV